MIEKINKLFSSTRGIKVQSGINLINRMKQDAFALDSIGADPLIKDIWLSRMVYSNIDNQRTSVAPMVIDTLKALCSNPVCIAMAEKQNDHYIAIENREFDKLVLKSSDNLADLWGTWCGPCREALSHSTEEYERLKDYDIQYLYLANSSPQTAWENVIKEYNVSGPNVAHYNLPTNQQAAIESHLDVHSWPTYKLFNRDGDLLDLQIDARDIENLAKLLDQMK